MARGCFFTTLGVGGFLVVMVFIGQMTGGSSGSGTAADIAMAYYECKQRMIPAIKAPSSARFSESPDARRKSDTKMVIIAYVDAQNSFGAMLRTQFICEAERSGAGWTITKIVTDSGR